MNQNELMEILKLGAPALVAIVAYVLASVIKTIETWNKKLTPFLNIGTGILAAIIGFVTGILSAESIVDIFTGVLSCVISALGAGGFYDVLKVKLKESQDSSISLSEAIKLYGPPPTDAPEAPVSHDKSEEVEAHG